MAKLVIDVEVSEEFQRLLDRIEAISALHDGGWVSVKDALPPSSANVEVRGVALHMRTNSWGLDEILAWRPLPPASR